MLLLYANIFQPLIDVFEAVLKFFHNSLGVSWGWSIVLLTVVIRALMTPLFVKQFHSMQRLQRVQPQMKALQQKYKEDKQRQQQEMMKFYKENNVNPFGSCLPLAAQLPVFISLFYMLRQDLRKNICPSIQQAYQAKYAALHHVSATVAAGKTTPCGARPRRKLPLHQRPDQRRPRPHVGRADPPLRGHAARLVAAHVRPHDGQDPAPADDGHAAVLRDLHHQLPRGRDRLLDHHERVDDPPAVRRAAPDRSRHSAPWPWW